MDQILKQGMLLKRGEFIKNWRPRWFILRADGSFLGYRTGPPPAGEEPLNSFDIAGSLMVLLEDKKAKKFGFTIRFIQMTRFVERSFHLDSAEERDEWAKAYSDTKRHIAALAAAKAAVAQPSLEAPQKQIGLNDYDMLKVLGKGTFGKVMLAKDKVSGQLVAIKVLKKDVILAKEEVAHTLTESAVLQRTSHPFLTRLYAAFQSKDLLCFVMEFVSGGELFFHLSREKVFTEARAKFYVAEILLAITYLHDNGIIYRDLKLENLLLDKDGHIKITDFGMCKEEITYGATTNTFCGTPEYLAPEILEDNDYGRAVDWWGTGVVMHEMLCGHLPFYSKDHQQLFELILKAELALPATLSSASRDLIAQLLVKDPHHRLGGGERDGRDIMAHPFFLDMNFERLERREIRPPFTPPTAGPENVTTNFDPLFTSQAPRISPTGAAGAAGALLGHTEDVKTTAFTDFSSTVNFSPRPTAARAP